VDRSNASDADSCPATSARQMEWGWTNKHLSQVDRLSAFRTRCFVTQRVAPKLASENKFKPLSSNALLDGALKKKKPTPIRNTCSPMMTMGTRKDKIEWSRLKAVKKSRSVLKEIQ
jgi:hypothetical protein